MENKRPCNIVSKSSNANHMKVHQASNFAQAITSPGAITRFSPSERKEIPKCSLCTSKITKRHLETRKHKLNLFRSLPFHAVKGDNLCPFCKSSIIARHLNSKKHITNIAENFNSNQKSNIGIEISGSKFNKKFNSWVIDYRVKLNGSADVMDLNQLFAL